jgi:hypothetical protein
MENSPIGYRARATKQILETTINVGRQTMDTQELTGKLRQIKQLADECLLGLNSKRGKLAKSGATRKSLFHSIPQEFDFNVPLQPFMARYSKGMSGPKKFTLLLARLTEGDLKKEISLAQIETNWNKMTSAHLLGMKFNRFYPVQAKDRDWVEAKRKGFYNLRPNWEGIIKQ